MKICKSCREEINEKATICPNCLTDQRNLFYRHPILTGLFVLILIGILRNKSTEESKYTQHVPRKSYSQDIYRVETETQNDIIKDDVPIEFRNALSKANTYSNFMHMSKKKVYEQLVSSYGEKFSVDASKYAIENVEADWKENALQKAITYQTSMNMSPAKIYEQLVSSYGEGFTKEEAEYAMKNLSK